MYLKNQNGNLRKLAFDIGMVFVIIILFVFVGFALGPYIMPFIGRILNFILNAFHM